MKRALLIHLILTVAQRQPTAISLITGKEMP